VEGTHTPAPLQQPLQPALSQVQAPFVQACEGAQATHAAPPCPHAATVGVLTHWSF
jgi:hypothetical protein